MKPFSTSWLGPESSDNYIVYPSVLCPVYKLTNIKYPIGHIKRVYYLNIGAEALARWLKLSAWKVGDSGFEARSSLQVSKEQNVSSSLHCKDPILCNREVACSAF